MPFESVLGPAATTLELGRFSIGVGDRFACQGVPQVRACQLALAEGVEITPVWNKSFREHSLIGSDPSQVRAAAERAVREVGWDRAWHVDADHIRLETVDRFLSVCDFFTVDVADEIGAEADPDAVEQFVRRHQELGHGQSIAGIPTPLQATPAEIRRIAARYLRAVHEAGRICRHIRDHRSSPFIIEISMDETDVPQTPVELLVILAAIADEGIPVQTIAPKFTGRFNKGVDYVGDTAVFAREFENDVCVIRHAVETYGLPSSLKLSVHSGSDKFSLYPIIREVLDRTGAGVHLKTAGTTWLEELIGLAESDGAALEVVVELYREAHRRQEELCAPYCSVIDIRSDRLPKPSEVALWGSDRVASSLRHDPDDPRFHPDMRQLMHVAFKLAARMGDRYLQALEENREIIGRNVTRNLYHRHILPLFIR